MSLMRHLVFLVLFLGAATLKTKKYVVLEMYAAAKSSDDVSAPGNVDLFDAAGLVSYLATQVVVETGKAPDRPARDNGIDTIVKYQIRIHNNMTSSDVDVQAEFSKYVRFDDGAVGTPEDAEMFERSGDLVGALSFHPPHGDVRFPTKDTFYWFSLSGPCPNMKDGEKQSSNCSKYQPGLVPAKKSQYVAGGLCQRVFTSTIPDGTPGCSYYIENFTKVSLDEVVGITKEDCGGRACSNWADFRLHCTNPNLTFTSLGVKYCKEYDYPGCITSCQDPSCGKGEVGLPFWTGRCNASRNAERASSIQEVFGGSRVEAFYSQNPRCEQYPMCDKPAPDAGVSYCHRDASGVCDPCYVPGTVRSVTPPSVVPCRTDLFLNKQLPQYKDALPKCDSPCGGECSLDSASAACCVYLGKCKRTWKSEAWEDCNATCGNGTRFRRVWCPFEELFGPCDETSRPGNATACRGEACPWSRTHFGNWSSCDNSCGQGQENQSLICDCPDDCPLKDKECAKSPKPSQPSRPCFQNNKKFCTKCGSDQDCKGCARGFTLDFGTCKHSENSALARYELSAVNLSLSDPWVSSAFVGAFSKTLKTRLTEPFDVLSSTQISELQQLQQLHLLPQLQQLQQLQSHAAQRVEVSVLSSASASDELRRLLSELRSSNASELGHVFAEAMKCSECPALGTVTWQLSETNVICEDGKTWSDEQCILPSPKKFPTWIIILIVGLLLLAALIAALFTWKCKRRSESSARLLGA